jgi:N-acetylmuramoyl-L-alanine amidase
MASLVACSPKPYHTVQKIQNKKIDSLKIELTKKDLSVLYDSLQRPIASEYIPTINFGLRKPNFVIIHHTAQDSLKQTIHTFTIERTQVSAHYIISASGEVVHLLNDYLRSWHAGASKWGNITDINSCSIGIELDNNGKQPFTKAQINSLLALLAKLKKDYNIPTANFIGHADIAPKRKTDPSILFPWKLLSDNGFGLWYDVPDLPPPADFDVENALRRIGYNTTDLNAAIIAFKRHFVQIDLLPTMSDWDKCVLWNLYKKY